MYAYIPSPFGGRLPSYALAKANKPEPEAPAPKKEKAEDASSASSDSSPFVSEFGPEFDEGDDYELRAAQMNSPEELDNVKSGILQNKQRMWDHDYYVMGSKDHPERKATIERVRNDPRHPHREEATRLWGASNPAPPAQAPAQAPAPESPKPEASTENPSPEPGPAPAAPSDAAQDAGSNEEYGMLDSPGYNWKMISADYARLRPNDQKMFNRYLKNLTENRTDPRQALQFLAKRMGTDVKGYFSQDAGDEGTRAANRKDYRRMLREAKVDPLSGGKGPNAHLTSNKDPVPDYANKDKEGTPTYIPLGNAKTKKVVDKETGEVTEEVVNAGKVARQQANRKKRERNALGPATFGEGEEQASLQGLVDSSGMAGVTTHDYAEHLDEESKKLTEMHQYPHPGKKDVIINRKGQNIKAGEELKGFVNPDKKDEVKRYYKQLGPIKSTDGSDLMVYVAPIRIGLDNVPVYFDKDGNRLGTAEHPLDENELDQLGDEFEAKYSKIIYSPFFGEREVADYKEEPGETQYHFAGGEMVGRKYKGKLKSLGNDISIGAVLDKDRKPVPLFFLGDYNVPLDLKSANLTREQRALIDKTLKDPPDFYQDANGNPRPKNAEEPAKEPKKKKNEPDPLADADLYSVKRDGSVVRTTKNTSQWDREALDFGKDVEINGKRYRPVVNTLSKKIIGYLPAEEKPEGEEATEPAAKSATMTIREMRTPSISDMIRDRRLRSAPYPSVTPLGRALP